MQTYIHKRTQEVLNQLPTSYLTSTEHVWVNSLSFKQIWEPWCKAAICINMRWLIITILLKGAKPMPPSSKSVFRLWSASGYGTHLPLACHQHLGDRADNLFLTISRKRVSHVVLLHGADSHSFSSEPKIWLLNGTTTFSMLQMSS